MATATPEFLAPATVPRGAVPFIDIPDSWDYPRLVYVAPYFSTVPLAELIDPSVKESIESLLPSLVPPYVQDAANTAVANLSVVKTGSTMTGPLFLNGLPTQPTQAATMSYVDMMVSTSGVPEVPAAPAGQTWGRQTGQWVAIASASGTFLPLSGGTMQGALNMGGNSITNLPAVPQAPYGAANMTWVLDQIAAQSLYQGTWNADNNTPDLTQPGTHQNEFSWIATTVVPAGVVVSQPIPGIQGLTIFNGDNLIYSAFAGQFQVIHAGGLTAPQADARYLMLTGGQLSGALLLNTDPTQAMQAATRQWVLAQTAFPESPADGQLYGRQGLSHSWMPVLPIGGGVLTGALTLNANAATALQAVPLQQLNSTLGNYVPLAGSATITGPITMAGGSSTLTLATNAAANLQAVPLQQLTSTLATYATTASVAATYAPIAGPVFTGDARAVTPTFGDNDTSIATTAFVAAAAVPAQNNVGRNLLQNALFNVQQRGAGAWTANGAYTADRWELIVLGADTHSAVMSTVTDANRVQIGDEAAIWALGTSGNGSATAGSYSYIQQSIEDVRRLAGKTVTVSFWAEASAAVKVGINTFQNFGTGGSPSASLWGTGLSVGPLTAAFVRYSVSIPIPSIAGKTLGTNNNSCTSLSLWLSASSDVNPLAGNIGVQSGIINLWGVQLEIGTQATPLEKVDPGEDLRRCQRFYQVIRTFSFSGYGTAGLGIFPATTYLTTMRAVPTVNFANIGYTNASALSIQDVQVSNLKVGFLATATGVGYAVSDLLLSSDL